MTVVWWVVLAAVLVACPIAAGIALGRARETGEVDQFREAIADVEREIGAALLPIVERVVAQLARVGGSFRVW